MPEKIMIDKGSEWSVMKEQLNTVEMRSVFNQVSRLKFFRYFTGRKLGQLELFYPLLLAEFSVFKVGIMFFTIIFNFEIAEFFLVC